MKKYLIFSFILAIFSNAIIKSETDAIKQVVEDLKEREYDISRGKKILKALLYNEQFSFWAKHTKTPLFKRITISYTIKEIIGSFLTSNIMSVDSKEKRRLVMLAIYGIAKESKGTYQGVFEEGTFVLEDNNNILFNFLNSCPGSYTRISTHFTNLKQQQYGIDFICDGEKSPLPAGKKHLLFGKIKEGYMFIKPETYGFSTLADIVMHGIEALQSKVRKIEYLQNIIGLSSDHSDSFKKERINPDWIKEFNQIVEKIGTDNVKATSEKALIDGVKYMVGVLHNYSLNIDHNILEGSIILDTEDTSLLNTSAFNITQSAEEIKKDELRNAIKKLLNILTKDDNTDVRTGSEVILKLNSLLAALSGL